MQRKWIALSAVFASLVIFFPSASSAEDLPACQMHHQSGQTADLEGQCQQQDGLPSPDGNSQFIRGPVPPGLTLQADGTIAMCGLTFRPVIEGGVLRKLDLLRPDGLVVQPGETLTLSNGQTIRIPLPGEPNIALACAVPTQ